MEFYFPHTLQIPLGPQSLDINVINITLNPEVSELISF